MRFSFFSSLCFASLLGSPALAQTGRIAHLSHGGGTATLVTAERADNFGIPPTEYKYERVTRLNDSMMLVEGQQRGYGSQRPWQPVQWQQQFHWAGQPERSQQMLGYLRKQYAEAQLVGFDTTATSPLRRKKSGTTLITQPPGSTRLPGSSWALLALAALAGAGWRLSAKVRPALQLSA